MHPGTDSTQPVDASRGFNRAHDNGKNILLKNAKNAFNVMIGMMLSDGKTEEVGCVELKKKLPLLYCPRNTNGKKNVLHTL